MQKIVLLSLLITSFLLHSQEQELDTIVQTNLLIIGDSSALSIVNYIKHICDSEKKKQHNNIIKQQQIDEIREERIRDICFKRHKVDGIKIKIGTTKTIEEANKLKREAMMLFPYISTPEIKDVRPNYYVIIGDYFSRTSAAKHFIQVLEKYPNSILIKWRVYCRKAIPHGK